MKTNWKILLLFVLPVWFATSCKDDATQAIPAFETLKTYMVEQQLDLNSVLSYNDGTTTYSFVQGAPATEADVAAFVEKYHIIDLRAAADYAKGHLQGAVNVAFANLLTEADKATKPILVVCYTGQTATYATSLLRMYGLPKTQALKWGMSGWNSTFDVITSKVGDPAKDHANWSYAAAEAPAKNAAPVLTVSSLTGADILKDRVRTVVAEGLKTVTGTEVLTTPTNYFINNYYSEADYAAFGHIKGAYRINPLLLADESILGLPTDRKVVTYCYTGQTSAAITAYLRVLGYDAYSLSFGMNGLYHSNTAWASNRWGFGKDVPKSLPTVTN